MSSRRTIILIAAIAVGVFAGIALLNYVRGIEDDVYADAQPVTVLIASEDIPEGTAAAEALQMMQEHEIPLEIRPATFVAVDNTESINGLVARGTIPKNQIIVGGLFVDPTVIQAAFKDQIPSGQVAVTLTIGQNEAVGGYVQPGDEVNIMIKHTNLGCAGPEEPAADAEPDEGASEQIQLPTSTPDGIQILDEEAYCTWSNPARYIFQRVEVLAVGARQTLQPGETTNSVIAPQGGPITFMVPNEAAQLIASLDPSDIHLTLLPEDYVAEQMRAITFDLLEGPTPAEIPECLTPYGATGYIPGDAVTTVEDDGEPTEHFSCGFLWGE